MVAIILGLASSLALQDLTIINGQPAGSGGAILAAGGLSLANVTIQNNTLNNNTGLGMWGNEFSLGTTLYFDQGKKWHAAGLGAYEIHTSKYDLDFKTGNVFTLEGGVGRPGAVGLAGWARRGGHGRLRHRRRSSSARTGPATWDG